VAREAVYNAVRHGQPSKVVIRAHFEPDAMSLEVDDDGCGFDPVAAMAVEGNHFGLVGMRERIESLGGQLEVRSSTGQGTRVAIKVPVRPVAAESQIAV
jgi:signal transduction histidine kinase